MQLYNYRDNDAVLEGQNMVAVWLVALHVVATPLQCRVAIFWALKDVASPALKKINNFFYQPGSGYMQPFYSWDTRENFGVVSWEGGLDKDRQAGRLKTTVFFCSLFCFLLTLSKKQSL